MRIEHAALSGARGFTHRCFDAAHQGAYRQHQQMVRLLGTTGQVDVSHDAAGDRVQYGGRGAGPGVPWLLEVLRTDHQ